MKLSICEVGLLIHEFAELVRLSPSTLRVLERQGLLVPTRDRNGWRRYDRSAVDQIRQLYTNGRVRPCPATTSTKERP